MNVETRDVSPETYFLAWGETMFRRGRGGWGGREVGGMGEEEEKGGGGEGRKEIGVCGGVGGEGGREGRGEGEGRAGGRAGGKVGGVCGWCGVGGGGERR